MHKRYKWQKFYGSLTINDLRMEQYIAMTHHNFAWYNKLAGKKEDI